MGSRQVCGDSPCLFRIIIFKQLPWELPRTDGRALKLQQLNKRIDLFLFFCSDLVILSVLFLVRLILSTQISSSFCLSCLSTTCSQLILIFICLRLLIVWWTSFDWCFNFQLVPVYVHAALCQTKGVVVCRESASRIT